MTVPDVFRRRDTVWDASIVLTAALALGGNLAGLLMGITSVLPHLLYIPVVITGYRYPRQGLLFSACIGVAYLIMVMVFMGWNSLASGEALVRCVFVIAIGGLVAFLTLRLRTQENLYQGLFENSEGGSILIRKKEGVFIVEEANWNAAALLHTSPANLKGKPVTSFWNMENGSDILARFNRDGKVYAVETGFSTADGGQEQVLLSLASLPGDQAILTFVDVTRRVAAERALQAANEKLHLLSRISSDRLHTTVDEMIEMIDDAMPGVHGGPLEGLVIKVRNMAWNMARQLFLSETYQDLGKSPPQWIPVQRIFESIQPPRESEAVSIRFWTERLELFADPLLRDVLTHVVDNALRHGGTVKNVIVSYHLVPGGIDLVIEDDGTGIPAAMKEKIFVYDAGGHSGIGLFICRQILAVTGMTMVENGIPGKGARFVIHVPEEDFRIEGSSVDAPAFPLPDPADAKVMESSKSVGIRVQELKSAEFPQANALWVDYHQTKGDPVTDRIFAAFKDGEAVSLGRCRRHPDGLEIDGIYTPEKNRGHGFANAVVQGLIEATGHDTLYMHSVLNLTTFYGHYGFVPIPEAELPTTIRERFAWAGGEMQGANVCPMRRTPPEPAREGTPATEGSGG